MSGNDGVRVRLTLGGEEMTKVGAKINALLAERDAEIAALREERRELRDVVLLLLHYGSKNKKVASAALAALHIDVPPSGKALTIEELRARLLHTEKEA